MKRQYTAVYIKEDSWYIGFCVEMAGCVTQGKTLASCRKNLLDAIRLIVELNTENLAEDYVGEIHVEGIVAGETKQVARMLEKRRIEAVARRREAFDLAKSDRQKCSDTPSQRDKIISRQRVLKAEPNKNTPAPPDTSTV